jgi:ribonuclease D
MTYQEGLPPPIWIDTAAGFRAMLACLRDQPAVAIDTESNSLYVYHERVCLLQVSVPGADYLVDPLALHDLSALGPLLADPNVRKVLHGAEYDLIVLYRDFSFTLNNLFDTMWASRILGWPAHGLAALLQEQFGVTLNKKYQRANWGLRPLPPEQLDYARLDTHYLLPLQQIQARELQASGRWRQAEHRFASLAETRWEAKPFDPEGFWKLPGVRDLDDLGRGVLRAIYLFRDQQARAEDRPPFKVLSNRALLALSEERPQTRRELQQLPGISARTVRKYGTELLAAIGEGLGERLAWVDRPRGGNHGNGEGNGRPTAAAQARFDALRTWRNATAEARGVEPDIVLSNQVLWAIAQRCPRTPTELAGGGLLARWQVDEFSEAILRVLRASR